MPRLGRPTGRAGRGCTRAYGQGPVNLAGLDDVISKFNSQLGTMTGTTGDPKAWLSDLQKNGEAALGG